MVARADGVPSSVLAQILGHTKQKQLTALKNLFKRMAEQGRAGLTDWMFSKACNDRPFVYKFKKQQLRVYCFLDDANRRMVLSSRHHEKEPAHCKEKFVPVPGAGGELLSVSGQRFTRVPGVRR